MNEVLLRMIRDAFPVGQPPQRPITGHRCEECDEIDEMLGGREARAEKARREASALYEQIKAVMDRMRRWHDTIRKQHLE